MEDVVLYRPKHIECFFEIQNNKKVLVAVRPKSEFSEQDYLLGEHVTDFRHPDKDYMGGESINIEQILDREIALFAFTIEKSKFNEGQTFSRLYFIMDKTHIVYTTTTAAGHVVKVLKKEIAEQLPSRLAIIRIGNRLQIA